MSFPRLYSRTQAFRLGRPVRFTISPDGRRVLFLRSRGGEDPMRLLWSLEVGSGEEHLLVDPLTLSGDGSAPSAQERIRRERARDRSSGIADYSADEEVRHVAFAVQEKLNVLDLGTGEVTPLPAMSPLTAATISPDGSTVAYVSEGSLRVIGVDGRDDRALASAEADVTYGLPEHVAAESMGRLRGYWWSPDSDRLAVARVDNARVQTWHLSDPSRPDAPPMARRYPPAGTDNADVSLWVIGVDGSRVEVLWDREAFEYLVEVLWDAHGLFIVVQDRAQHELRVLAVVAATGATTEVARVTDPAWTQIVPGVPVHLADGALVWTVDDDQTRRLTVDGTPVTPGGLQVAEVVGVDGDTVLFIGSHEPTEGHLWTWSPDAGPVRLTSGPGRHSGRRSAGLTVISSSTLSGHSVSVHSVSVHSVSVHGDEVRAVKSLAVASPVEPRVTLMNAGPRELRTAVLFPAGWQGERLPVLMDPYGGPAAQRAMADRDLYWASQWFADQGFAVIVADGRGTPGRGPAWEREIYLDRSDALLEDQIEALQAVATAHPELDLSRVGIRGWSDGGYLAALAVLRRPDVFHAAVAGAPVTDQLLYDTHWQERFLGDPRVDRGPYQRSSIIDDAPKLTRPLMLIHGLLDDNVYPVHTMRLSAALLAAGRPHTVLPLPGASHMPPDTDMLTPQLDFLRAALG
jgi:dipeptidyl-peptidase-4